MRSPAVSFFVQAYNTGEWAGECLRSILDQRGDFDFEIIVIDDASTDNTAEVIEAIRDPRIRFARHSKNAGVIGTANEGYAAAAGACVIRVDSDDRLRPYFLQRTVPILEANPTVGFVYGDIATMDSTGQITCEGGMVRRDRRQALGDEFFPLLLDNFIPAPTTLVRREALLPILPIPIELSFLDWYVTTGVAERWLTYYIDGVLADYRLYSGNQHSWMVQDRSGEDTIFKVLERLFGNSLRAEEKSAWKRCVRGNQYLVLADKYFGARMNADARRCYWRAVRNQPGFLARPGIARRFAATLTNRELYEHGKRWLRGDTSAR